MLLTLDPDELKLHASYIGGKKSKMYDRKDSSYMIIRQIKDDLEIVFVSEEQSHSFNFPFQIGKVSDNPEEAIEITHEVKQFDIIIVGSDGYQINNIFRLFDNLDPIMIKKVMSDYMRQFNLTVKNLRHK